MAISADEIRRKFPEIAGRFHGQTLDVLARAFSLHEVPEGQALIRDGTAADTVYLVWEGRLVAFLEGPGMSVELGHVGPGQWVGEVSMLDAGPAVATVQAETDAKLLGIGRREFKELNRDHPEVAGVILRLLVHLMIERLRRADELMLGAAADTGRSTAADEPADHWGVKVYRRLMGLSERAT